jgi:hypothetical protein
VPWNVNVTGCRTFGPVGENVNSAVGAADAVPTVEKTATNETSSVMVRAPRALTCVPKDFMTRLPVVRTRAEDPRTDDRAGHGRCHTADWGKLKVFSRVCVSQ